MTCNVVFSVIYAGILILTELFCLPVTTSDDDFDILAGSLGGTAIIIAIFFSCTAPCVVRFIDHRRLKIVRVLELLVFIASIVIVYFLSYGFVYELRDQAIGNFLGNEYYASFVILLYLCSTEFLPTFACAYQLDLFSKLFQRHTEEELEAAAEERRQARAAERRQARDEERLRELLAIYEANIRIDGGPELDDEGDD